MIMVDREGCQSGKGVEDTASCSQSTRVMHGGQEWIMPFVDASESSYRERDGKHVRNRCSGDNEHALYSTRCHPWCVKSEGGRRVYANRSALKKSTRQREHNAV